MSPERAALLERAGRACRRARALREEPRHTVATTGRLRVHIGFRDALTREQVLELLDDLGPWPEAQLDVEPGRGVTVALPGERTHLALLAARERLDRALVGLDAPSHVSLHVARELLTG